LNGRRLSEEDFWNRVDASGDCWLWTGRLRASGYSEVRLYPLEERLVHRVAWFLLCGPVPAGLTLDHLCRVRHCVNPDHLEPVTQQENNRRSQSRSAKLGRQVKCRRGHDFDKANTYVNVQGKRRCRACQRILERQRPLKGTPTQGQINSAKTHCRNGHPYDATNTYVVTDGSHVKRTCRTCSRANDQRHRAKLKAQRVAVIWEV
jgi:HNH endonuclease